MALMAENAQDYRERGLAVFPVGRNKHPLVAWKPYQEELPHPDEVIAWWDRWPDANIGVATGKVSDLVVLDADGPEGIVSLKALNTVATTWLSKTARGYHQFFRHPGRPTPNRAGIRPGLDVRGDGGYAILPPSLHASGSRYEWRTAPRDLPLAPLPDDLLVLLTEPTAHVPVVAGAKTIPEGQRNDHLYRVARALLAKALGAPAVLAALLEENRTRCVPPLPDADVREIAEHAATQAHRFDFRLTGAGAEAAQVSPGLVAGPYSVDEGRICRQKPTRDGTITEPLCNFAARIVEELVLDDGAETTRSFVIEGALETEQSLPRIRIPAHRFGTMDWVTEHWGVHAIVRAGQSTRDHLREAIQRLSPAAGQRRVFMHTGWREIDGVWTYLAAAGGLGHDGTEVDLGPELARYRLPDRADDPAGAMRDSLGLLRVAPLTVTVPLFAGVYRAPLASALPLDLSLWLEGITGSLKSTLAALFVSHYGDFVRTNLPGAWSSTANQLERRAFLLKDTVFVVDDYAPSGFDTREMEGKAARLLRAAGNGAGRGRLRSDLSDRPAFPPRGLILATGEQHPAGRSVLARTLVMQLERAAVNLEALSAAQQRAPRLAHAMAGYLAWLAPQMPTLRGLLVETFTGARARATADGEHLRVPEALAHLWIGVHSALTYAQEIGACSVEEAENIREECWAALLGLGRQHGGLVEEERPSRRFLRVLLTLHTQRRGHLADRYEPDDRPPPGAELLGWVDAEALYLLPEAAYEAVARFCHQTGEPFPIREERLTRDLKIDGLSECDPKRLTRTVAIGGRTRRVLKLHRAAVETLTGEAIAVSSPDLTGLTGLGE